VCLSCKVGEGVCFQARWEWVSLMQGGEWPCLSCKVGSGCVSCKVEEWVWFLI
jgi:hypothetical protein